MRVRDKLRSGLVIPAHPLALNNQRQLDERRMIGHHVEVRAPEIWQNVAKNVARQPIKAPAISVLRQRA